jgi:hypothetical protein
MRNVILIAAAGLAIALGASAAYATPIPAGGSPYEFNNAPEYGFSPLTEGRAAYTNDGDTRGSNPNGAMPDAKQIAPGASQYQ